MVSPLLESFIEEPAQSDLLGRESRKRARKLKFNSASKRALEAFQKELPELWQDPPLPVTPERYRQAISGLERQINGPYRDRHAGWLAIARFIDAGNSHGLWNLPVPFGYVRQRAPKPLRSLEWHMAAQRARGVYSQLCEALEGRQRRALDCPKAAAGFALITASLVGGLCQPEALVQLAVALHTGKPFLHTDRSRDLVWVDLYWQDDHRSTYEDGEDLLLYRRWHVDTWSLAALGLALRMQPGDPLNGGTHNQKTTLALINAAVKSLTAEKPFRSLRALTRVGPLISADRTDIPQAVYEVLTGDNPSFSEHPESFLWRVAPPSQARLSSISLDTTVSGSAPTVSRGSVTAALRSVSGAYRAIRSAVRAKDPDSGRIRSKSDLEQSLLKVDAAKSGQAALLLHSWAQSLVDRGLASSTVYRYIVAIGKSWLTETENLNFDGLDADDFVGLYESILEYARSENTTHYNAGRLVDLHAHLVARYDFPSLPPDALPGTSGATKHIRTRLLPGQLLRHVLDDIGLIAGIDAERKRIYQVMLILACRTGMRPGEMRKLMLCEVEDSHDRWIFIKKNGYGTIKSQAARRKLPAAELLLEHEREIFEAFLAERRLKSDHPYELVFATAAQPRMPLDERELGLIFRQLTANRGLPLNLYQARHSCLTGLQCVLDECSPGIELYTDYSEEQAQRVRQAIAGKTRYRAHRYFHLSAFAGHASPKITFESYLHANDLVAFDRIESGSQTASAEALQYLSGLSANRLTRRLKAAESGRKAVPASLLRSDILGQMKPWVNSVRSRKHFADTTKPVTLTPPRITVFDKRRIVEEYQRGKSLMNLVFDYNVPEEQIAAWISLAEALAGIQTRRKTSRTIAGARHVNNREGDVRPVLTPALPQDVVVRKEAVRLTEALVDTKGRDRERARWGVRYWMDHVHTSDTDIRFYRPSELRRFLAILAPVIPMKRWRIDIRKPVAIAWEETLKRWQLPKPVITNQSEKDAKAPQLQKFGIARLRLRHSKEKHFTHETRMDITRWSSSALRFAMHTAAFELLEPEDVCVLKGANSKKRK